MTAEDLIPTEAVIWLDNRQIILYLQSLKNSIPKYTPDSAYVWYKHLAILDITNQKTQITDSNSEVSPQLECWNNGIKE
jgi:hypothetical protein